RALKSSLSQHVDSLASSPKVKKETFPLELRENFFIAAGQWVADGFRFRRSVPVGCRRDFATTGGKSDAKRFISIFLGHQLANIDFATLTHFGSGRIAQMRIMRPDDNSGFPSQSGSQVAGEFFERLEHMPVS